MCSALSECSFLCLLPSGCQCELYCREPHSQAWDALWGSQFLAVWACVCNISAWSGNKALFTEDAMSDSHTDFYYSKPLGYSKELYLSLPLSPALGLCPFLLAICLSRVYLFGLFEQELGSPVDGSLRGYSGSVQTCYFSDYLYNLFVYILLLLYL